MDNRFSKKLSTNKYPVFFVIVLLFITSIPLYFSYLQYNQVIKLTQDRQILQKQKLTFYVEKSLNNTRDFISRSLNLMAKGSEIRNYLATPSHHNKATLEKFWIFIAKDQQIYNQIRFLDTQGQERIRINYDAQSNKAYPAEYLQNKAQRRYFIYAKSLHAEEQAVYALDLEKENGEYIRPYRAAYRIIMPVDFDNIRYGYMIINLDIQRYIHNLSDMRPDIKDLTVINPQGYYVLGEDKHKLHGQILPERKAFNLAEENPQLWQQMQNQGQGIYKGLNTTYVFKKISLSDGRLPITLIALTHINRELVYQSQSDVLNGIKVEAMIITLFLLSIGISFSVYLRKAGHRRLQNRLVSAAMQGISAIVVTNKANEIIKVNEEFTRITGYSEYEVLGKNPHILQSGIHSKKFYQALWKSLEEKGEWEGEITNYHKDGRIITQLSRIQSIKDKNEIINYIASFVDISDRKELENKLRHLSEKDSLTMLWNRRVFEERLASQSQERARYSKQHFCSLAVLDIDFFKKVNDTYGHQKGDQVIQQVANALASDSRDVDTVARIGGEEFAIILPYTHLDDAILLLNRKRKKIQDDSDIGVTISAGVVELSTQCLGEEAYKAADMALYKAKEGGRNKVCSSELS